MVRFPFWLVGPLGLTREMLEKGRATFLATTKETKRIATKDAETIPTVRILFVRVLFFIAQSPLDAAVLALVMTDETLPHTVIFVTIPVATFKFAILVAARRPRAFTACAGRLNDVWWW